MSEKKHFNSKVAKSRGESWKKNLIKGHIEQKMHPSKLRLARVEKGISQIDAAKQLNLSPSTYGEIERGKRLVKPLVADKAAAMVGKKLSLVFKTQGKKFIAVTGR